MCGWFLQLACLLVLATVQASQNPCQNIDNDTDAGGDPCSYYASKPHHCGCCDTSTFKAAACCACQQTPEAGNSTWWTSVFLTWPLKARTLHLPGKGIQAILPSDIAGRWPHLIEVDLSQNQLTGTLPPSLASLSQLSHLDLSDNRLSGTLPAALGQLGSLQYLSLHTNRLSGGLPAEMGNMTSLQTLDLQSNSLSGTLPAELGNLTNLQTLELRRNALSGSLPRELGNLTSLETLSLAHNQLSGSLPAELGKLTSLQYLSIMTNQFGGSIPAELGNLTSLRQLFLQRNALSGTLPVEFGNLVNLQDLRLLDNELSGAIPAEWGNMKSLRSLRMNANALSGSLPAELGKLASLTRLTLFRNQLSGSLPAELGNLTSLQFLDVAQNKLSGTIPAEFGNLTNLVNLNLYRNQLVGSLPPGLGNLVRLTELYLFANELGGPLPPELGNCRSLQEIKLGSNQFSGPLPPEFEKLTSLWLLDLSENHLNGSLPPGLGSLRRLLRLWLAGNQLEGGLPPELGQLTRLDTLYLHRNHFNGSLPPELGNLASLRELRLGGNQLNGTVPPELGNLTSLEELDVSDNQIGGNLPQELGGLENLRTLTLRGNQFRGGLPRGLSGLRNLKQLDVSANPLFCGETEVLRELGNLTELELRDCCFQDFGVLPASLERLDLGGNLLTEVPRLWREQASAPGSLKILLLDGNRIEEWDTSAVVPQGRFRDRSWQCGYRPTGQRLPWQNLETLDVSSNPLGKTAYEFLASLSHLSQLRVLQAREVGLRGALPQFSTAFVPYMAHTGDSDCTDFPGEEDGFPALLTLDLSGNSIHSISAEPSLQLLQADLSRNELTVLHSEWWSGGVRDSLQRVDVTGNTVLRLPVLLDASVTCPGLGATDLIANSQDWKARLDHGGRVECTTLCPMSVTRFLADVTVNESVLCRCTEGQGIGMDCSPCPKNTYSTMSLASGQYSRGCQACPAKSHLQDFQGVCFADCSCSASHYMAQISNGSGVQDVGTTPCSRLAPEGKCLSCGIFKDALQGSRRASDCFCNGNRSNGGWEGLLERQGQCGCPDGFHMNFAERTCVPCQAQEDCMDWTRSLEPPIVKRGFWALPAPPRGSDGLFGNFSSHSIWRCLSVTACPGNSVCAGNLMGTACSLCRRGYFRLPSGSCTPCSRGPAETRGLLLAGLLACVVFPILANFQIRAQMGEAQGLALAFRSVRTSMKQLLKFAQIMGLVSLFGVEWPRVAAAVFAGARSLSLDSVAWLGVACLDTQQEESMPLVVGFLWMLPIAGVGVTGLASLVVTVSGQTLCPLAARCCRRRPSQPRLPSAQQVQVQVQVQAQAQPLQFQSLDVMRVLIFLLHLFFPSLLKNALLPLTCSPSPNGLLTMNQFRNVVCWDTGFWTVASLGMLQAALLSLGFPLLLFSAWRCIDDSRTLEVLKKRQRWWAFVFVEFRPQKMSWVLVATCKDILLNLIVAVLPGLGTAQLLVTSVVSVVYACAAFCVSPFPDVSNTLLETFTAAAVAGLCLVTASAGFQSERGLPSLEAGLDGDGDGGSRDGSSYTQRTVLLVCVQGLSLGCPAAIVAFQLLMAFPRSQRCVPVFLQPMSVEQREEWSQSFARAMRLEGGPLPKALAELDSVDFAAFRQAAIAGKLTWRTLAMKTTTRTRGSDDRIEEEEEFVPALHARITELQASNSALCAENGALSSENGALQIRNAVLQAALDDRDQALDDRDEEAMMLRKTIEQLRQQVIVHRHGELTLVPKDERAPLPDTKRPRLLLQQTQTDAEADVHHHAEADGSLDMRCTACRNLVYARVVDSTSLGFQTFV